MGQIDTRMAEATRLTMTGALFEATSLIQRMLRGEPEPRSDDVDDGVIDAEFTVLEPETAPEAEPVRSPAGGARTGLRETLERLAEERARARPAPERAPAPAEERFELRRHAGPAGARDYRLYVPAQVQEAMPLVVMLHGCSQTAEDFAAGTAMNALAEAQGFLVAYPEQTSSANANRCWNWFRPEDQRRDAGEPAVIAGIVRDIAAELPVDRKRIFVAGLSAGGAAAVNLASAYPDLFAAVGVHSGLPAGAARDLGAALSAMRRGAPGAAGHSVPLIVFHGDRDTTVSPANSDALLEQAGVGQATRSETGQAPGGRRWTREIHEDAEGRLLAERWIVHGGGHGWSGGNASGSYADPRGPDASAEMTRFFLTSRS